MIIKDLIVDDSTILKHLVIDDAPFIYHAIDTNRNHLRTWLPFVDSTKSVKDTISFVKSVIDDVERRQEIFTIWYNSEFAGLIGLKDIDYLNRKIEIGYWLIERMTGKGITIHSVERLIEFIFNELEFNRIQIKCGVGNHKSEAIPIKLGFTFEGIEHQGELHTNKYIDLKIFSLIASEWQFFNLNKTAFKHKK